MSECLNCGKKLRLEKLKYCSNYCQMDKQYKDYIVRWKKGLESGLSGKYELSNYLKRYIFEKYDNKCSQCGWKEKNIYTGKIPLEIEHVDGDYRNNKEDNLILLCPNCHSLTSTYKGANRGKGRKERSFYWENNKTSLQRISLKKKRKCLICGKMTKNKYTCSHKCRIEYERKVIPKNKTVSKRPSKAQLVEDLTSLSFIQVGKKYNVADNTVRNWCKSYNIPYKKLELKEFLKTYQY